MHHKLPFCQVVDIVRSLASRNIEQSVESFASHIFASCGTTFHDSPSTAFTTPAYTAPPNPTTEPTTTEATTTEGSGGGGNESERDESESESESEESESESESERDESESESERDESECQESEGEGSEGEETKNLTFFSVMRRYRTNVSQSVTDTVEPT